MTKTTRLKLSLAQLAGTAALMSVSANAQVSWETHGHLADEKQENPTGQNPPTEKPTIQNSEQQAPTISCFNAQRLKSSLDQMIAPMSRAEQKSFMTGFFHYVYASRPLKYTGYGSVTVWGRVGAGDLAVYSANGFLNDGRMDDLSPARAYTAYGKSAGYSATASYNKFLDNYCANVEGMDRAKLTALGKDTRCLKSLARHQVHRGILGRKKLAKGCDLPVLPIGQ